MENKKLTECRDDIIDAINNSYKGDNHRDINVSDVIDKHGAEAVQTVLAATIQRYNWDGRFSPDNKEWARGFSLSVEQRDAVIEPGMSHPYITNGVTDMVRKEISEREKAAEKENGIINESTNHFEIYGDSTGGVTLFTFDNDDKANNAYRWDDLLSEENYYNKKSCVKNAINEARAGAEIDLRNDVSFTGEHAQNAYENIKSSDPDMAIYDVSFLGDENGLDENFKDIIDSDFMFRVLKDNTLSITDYSGEYEDKDIVIPSEIGGHEVIQIDDYAFAEKIPDDVAGYDVDSVFPADWKGIKSVTIPDTVKYIGEHAFEGCENLKDVSLSKGIEQIFDFAFTKCTSLESIDIPENTKQIRVAAFADCTNLKDVNLHTKYCGISYHSFENCTSLESVTIPNGEINIGDYAFEGCVNLKSVTILGDTSKMNIGENAFPADTKIKETPQQSKAKVKRKTRSQQTKLPSDMKKSGQAASKQAPVNDKCLNTRKKDKQGLE